MKRDALIILCVLCLGGWPSFAQENSPARNAAGAADTCYWENLGIKAIGYVQCSSEVDIDSAYFWLKESVEHLKEASSGAVLYHFADISFQRAKSDRACRKEFLQDYGQAFCYAKTALLSDTTDENRRKQMGSVLHKLSEMLIKCKFISREVLEEAYLSKVRTQETDSVSLCNMLSVLKLLECEDGNLYVEIADSLYRSGKTGETASMLAYAYSEKGEYDACMHYFDEAIALESDEGQKADIAYDAALVLFKGGKWMQARGYCQKALLFNEHYGRAYLLLAYIYASDIRWSRNSDLNKCTYFLVIDKLLKAKSVDPDVAQEADQAISMYASCTPKINDLFLLGYREGDRITIGGWIGETTTIR